MRGTSVELLVSHFLFCSAGVSMEKGGSWSGFGGKQCAITVGRDEMDS